MDGKLKVCIIGAEGWGSAIAAAVSNNVLKGDFDSRVHIYVYDEMIRNSVLSEVINSRHENIKYLPGIKLPTNLIAVNDLLEAAQNADILIFSTPHEFVKSYCNILSGNLKESAFAVSMTKGLMRVRDEEIGLVSHTISERLGIPCYSMMSTHSAMKMAQGKLCEVTIGCNDDAHAKLLTTVLQTNNCRVNSVNDVDGVELCGTLTDVIALGAGFADGLRLGENARVAAVHLGIKEMMRFIKAFFPSAKMSTFYESCGVANSVASSYVDKNATFAKSLVTSGKTIEEIEAYLHKSRRVLGPKVASDVNVLLQRELMQHEFPLFTAIHLICQSEAPPDLMLEALRNHPDLSNSSISQLLNHEKGEPNMDLVLDQVADTLPKLRTALDKVLIEAGNESFKHLKVTEDWTEVNDYDVEESDRRQVAPQDEIEEIPNKLSVQAARLHNDILDGNVQVAFKMDIDEGDRHVRLLLEEDRDANRTGSAISPRLVAGQESNNDSRGRGNFINSSSEHMANRGPDTPDVLDISSESEPLDDVKPNPSKLSEMASLKLKIDEQEAANFKAQENLIKSIRQTIQALGDKEKMESLIANSQMKEDALQMKSQEEEESSQLRSQMDEETSEPETKMVEETSQLKSQMEEESSHMTSQMEGETARIENQMEEEPSQLNSQMEEEALEPKNQMEEETSELKSQMEEETSRLKNLADKSELVGHNAEEEQFLEEPTDKHQYKLKSNTESLKALMFNESEEPLESEKLVEMKLQDEHDFDLDEEPAIAKKNRTYTKENMELEELLEWQKLMRREKEFYSTAELEDPTAWEDNSRLPIEHEDRLQDMTSNQEAELIQVRAEKKEVSGAEDEKLLNKVDDANFRYYSENKGTETGHYEWDWLKNNEKLDTDEIMTEFSTNEIDETLSKSDQDKLENLTHQLNGALQHDLEVLSASRGDESNEALSEDLDPEAAKKITEQPTPTQIPAVPLPMPLPNKQSHIREGTPQFQNPPRSVPPPSPQTKPPSPKEQQPHPTTAPMKFQHMDEVIQPEMSVADQEVTKMSDSDQKVQDARKVSKIEPLTEQVAKNVSTLESPKLKEETTPKQSRAEIKRSQQSDSSKPPGDATPTEQRKTTGTTEKQRQNIENQKAQLERMGKKISVMRKGQDRRVSYRGENPFRGQPDLESRPPMDTSHEKDRARESQGLGHQRRKVVVTPPFHPPINPRMRVPRPPFDGRDHEFHTMSIRPVGEHLVSAGKWPPMPTNLRSNRTSLVATIQVKQFGALPSQGQSIPRPWLKIPSGVPRTPTFTKIICALQLGLLATYLAQRKRD
ncbi:uncharacterized protein LOC119560659 [Drosophila subpulchrella]|uniref:uncharacterized protein LOC119560659 n=1 Tax=Drosophila subpulchrella TaxID=1486046 RepID=UPI0018A17327|nr:uncharacterized protein LOC119560659 [Drosophila subpulchrella]